MPVGMDDTMLYSLRISILCRVGTEVGMNGEGLAVSRPTYTYASLVYIIL